jgi:hypothetical protein
MSTALPVKCALALLKRRPKWYIFPIKAGAKFPPLLPDNLDTGNSKSPEQVKAWGKQYPGCNFGLALKKSHAIVPDIDIKPGKVGDVTWDRLKRTHADELGDAGVDDTFTVRTPSGGFHCYFDETDAVRYKFALGVDGFGIDVDSTNYVVLPGGRSRDGVYCVVKKSPIAPAPDWFADYLKPSNDPPPSAGESADSDLDTKAAVRRAVDWLEEEAPPSILGKNGEKTLLIVAAQIKDFGISENLAIEMLDRVYNNEAHCYAIVSGEHVAALWGMEQDGPDSLPRKVRNAYEYCTQNAPGSNTGAATDFGDDVEEFVQ